MAAGTRSSATDAAELPGWIDPMQLGGGRDPKVYNDDGDQVGYWVDNLGFVAHPDT